MGETRGRELGEDTGNPEAKGRNHSLPDSTRMAQGTSSPFGKETLSSLPQVLPSSCLTTGRFWGTHHHDSREQGAWLAFLLHTCFLPLQERYLF